MHNRWNLEFDIDNVPGYEILMDFDGRRILDSCYLSNRVTLSGTWEQVVLLSIPVVLEGKVRGVCGVELSELFLIWYSRQWRALTGIWLQLLHRSLISVFFWMVRFPERQMERILQRMERF